MVRPGITGQYYNAKVAQYNGTVWGYASASISNRAAGVGFVCKKPFAIKHVASIWSPEPRFQRRGGAIRLRSGRFTQEWEINLGPYPPPGSNDEKANSAAAKEPFSSYLSGLDLNPGPLTHSSLYLACTVSCDNMHIDRQVAKKKKKRC